MAGKRNPPFSRRYGFTVPSPGLRPFVLTLLITAGALAASECSPRPSSAESPSQVVVWRQLGAWSGHGSTQTETFLFQNGVLRVRWEAKRNQPTAEGSLRLVLHSSVSGRPLVVAADQRGPGKGEASIAEESRPAFILVESENLDWSFSVEEGEAGTVEEAPTRSQR